MNERRFVIEYGASAIRDLDSLPPRIRNHVLRKIERRKSGLSGDIKRLRHADVAYRLRAGNFRILFDIEANSIIVRRIKDRKKVYD